MYSRQLAAHGLSVGFGPITGIRLAGLATVLTLGAFLGLMFRRERVRRM
jgi:hypothetical protein